MKFLALWTLVSFSSMYVEFQKRIATVNIDCWLEDKQY